MLTALSPQRADRVRRSGESRQPGKRGERRGAPAGAGPGRVAALVQAVVPVCGVGAGVAPRLGDLTTGGRGWAALSGRPPAPPSSVRGSPPSSTFGLATSSHTCPCEASKEALRGPGDLASGRHGHTSISVSPGSRARPSSRSEGESFPAAALPPLDPASSVPGPCSPARCAVSRSLAIGISSSQAAPPATRARTASVPSGRGDTRVRGAAEGAPRSLTVLQAGRPSSGRLRVAF